MSVQEVISQVRETLDVMSDDERNRLIAELEQLLRRSEEPEKPSCCPRCACEHIVKKGRTPTGQRYLCKGCGRTFGATTNRVLGRSKLDMDTWEAFITCFIDGITVRRSAQRCSVSVKTAFFMRHRLLEIVEHALPRVVVGEGNTAVVDETFFPLNYKGATPRGRKSKKRGKSAGKRGLSKEQLCVVMGVTSTGEVFHQIAGCGTLSKKRARLALGDVVKPGSTVITDKAVAYAGVIEEMNATHTRYDAQHDRGALSPINALHSKVKRFMRRFVGVASKNLSRYLSWMLWMNGRNESQTLDALTTGLYHVTRSHMTADALPPMDTLARLSVLRKF